MTRVIVALMVAMPLVVGVEACVFDVIGHRDGALAIGIPVPHACDPEGSQCKFDNNCCTRNCVKDPRLGHVCKPKGEKNCTPQGHVCTFNSDCCTKNCDMIHNKGKMCRPRGAKGDCMPENRECRTDGQCCSKNCDITRGGARVCMPDNDC